MYICNYRDLRFATHTAYVSCASAVLYDTRSSSSEPAHAATYVCICLYWNLGDVLVTTVLCTEYGYKYHMYCTERQSRFNRIPNGAYTRTGTYNTYIRPVTY